MTVNQMDASVKADPTVHLEKGSQSEDSSDHGLPSDEKTDGKIPRVESTAETDAFIDLMNAQLAPVEKRSSIFRPTFKDPRYFTWTMVLFASMDGLLFGLDQSSISGANLTLPYDLGFTVRQQSLVNGLMPAGAVVGALLLSPVNEYFGRRGAIILSTILYTIGAALEAGAMDYAMMLSGRLVLGLGIGIETGTVPVYVAETVERRFRGNLVSLYQFNIALGEVFGFVVAAIFIRVKGNWRYILGSSIVFSVIMFTGMLFLPESPRYLAHSGKTLEAFAVWKRIRGLNDPASRAEFHIMVLSVEEREREKANKTGGNHFAWLDLFRVPRARRAFVYANTMMLLGQFVGINGIMYYMSVLMTQIGFDPVTAVYMSMANTMLPGFFIGLVLIGVSYTLDLVTQQTATVGLYITGLILYMGFYGTYACLTWVIPSEVYPTYLRSYGMTSSTAMINLGNFVISYNFTGMQEAMTKPGLTLGFFGGIAVIGWFYQMIFMPETKNLTLGEIDIVFSKPTKRLAQENISNVTKAASQIAHFRFKELFADVTKERVELDREVFGH
ncbi:hypothetical protein LTR78_007991 [Recurvomyces mirabilis]|uniref:Major facilitator superfamily (MFS) profile domain-containing protein n=1 Tax=Recurvomyces mirabilis TaxID=574656 RepID=A0AAE0TQR1_9PEZI|nr:hypothetical protein LTR78_007991 [Recurvomyces mirabilis]